MAYATAAQIETRVGADLLAQLCPADDGYDAEKVAAAITEASAEVDSYAMQRYTVPLDPIPDMVVQVTCDLAMWRLFLWHGYDPERDAEVKVALDSAQRWLRDLSSGRVGIGVASPAKDLGAEISSSPRLFSRDTMGGF